MPASPNDRQPIAPLSVAPDGRRWEDQPAWRRSVPIDTARETVVDRRSFLRAGLATGAALTLAHTTAWALGDEDDPFPVLIIAGTDDLAPGQARLFHYPDDRSPCLLLRTGRGPEDYVAYSQACTHLQCPVVPQPEQGRLFCPCHNGAFDIATGAAIQGPPRRPLPRIRLRFSETGIAAVGRSAG